MNNAVYLRLEGLMKKLGLSVAAGTFTSAEMKAYAAAIDLVCEKMNSLLKNVFIDTADNAGISMFLSMVGEKPAATNAASRELIVSAVADNRGIYSKTQFDTIVKTIGTANQSSYTINGNCMNFLYAGSVYRPTLDDYSKLITDYNPCTVVLKNKIGRTFEHWDEAAFRWYETDKRNLPFVTLDFIVF